MIGFFIASEQNARMLRPAIEGLTDCVLYRYSTVRSKFIDKVLAGVERETRELDRLFVDILDNRGVYVLPVVVGNISHPVFRELPRYEEYMAKALGELESRVVIMNENPYYVEPRYRPHAHVWFARSAAERVMGLDTWQLPDNFRVETVGDPCFAMSGQEYKKETKTLLIATANDPSRESGFRDPIQEMCTHLKIGIQKGDKWEKVILKQHPGATSSEEVEVIRSFCEENGLNFVLEDRMIMLEETAKKVDVALVQSSLSTHLNLRKNGVESFLYWGNNEANHTTEFLKETGMPPSKYHHKLTGKYSAKEYDEWINNTFLGERSRDMILKNLRKIEENK